jgi:CRISPR-associated protein Cas1
MPNDPAPAAPSTVPSADSEPRAKSLSRRLPMVGSSPGLVPARMVNEVLYCERLLYLEWAQGEFADNVFTVEGRAVHKRADQPGGHLPNPPAEAARPDCADGAEADRANATTPAPVEPMPYQARTLWLSSERLGMTAKIDVVEGDERGRVVPIEYKRGKAPDLAEGAYLPERAQLCAQVLLLRDHGYHCDHGDIYFAGSRKRITIEMEDALVAATLNAAARARALTECNEAPAPLVDSPKCNGCSLVGICLPDEINLLRGLRRSDGVAETVVEPTLAGTSTTGSVAEETDAPALLDDDGTEGGSLAALRRLHPASDDKVPLYVQEQGARIGLDGECLVVRSRKNPDVTARLPNTSHVVVYGNVQMSAQAIRALLERAIPVSFLSYGGWYYGRAVGVESKNVELRVAQHRAAADPQFCLRIARGLVISKVRNSRTMLRRNHVAPPLLVLTELEQLARKAERAESLGTLLGLEGTAARSYFGAFTGMLKGSAALSGDFDLDGRNRRPPRDPINAMLSFAYCLLVKDFTLATSAVGLDPLLGFYHQPRFGRPALALDLLEEFRPLVADSVVVGALNGGGFGVEDFQFHSSGVVMRPAARRRLLLAYERRMDQLITHPVFGYRISYRRVLEVQARLFARCLLGEIEEYPSFRTR